MRKIINRVLRMLGFKLIRAKRKADEETLLHSAVMRALLSPLKKGEMWQHIPDNPPGVIKATCVGKSPYVGTCASDPGKTHFVGDGCDPAHILPVEDKP